MNIFQCEKNILIAAIVGSATAIISLALLILVKALKLKKLSLLYIFSAISLVSTIVATLFSYNIIVVVGYIISIICTGLLISHTCNVNHFNTIYKMGPVHLFGKIMIPLAIIFQYFRPMFVYCKDEMRLPYYRLLAGIGLKCYDAQPRKWGGPLINSEGLSAFDVNFKEANFMTYVVIVVAVAVMAMQVLLILRQFKDPDNARDWADIGIIATCIGTIFVYGMFDSTNLGICDPKYAENLTLTIPVIVCLGLLNRVLYFEKVENLLDKLFVKKQ